MKTINPTGMDTNPKISEVPIDEMNFNYCSINSLRLVNLNIHKFYANYAVIKDSKFVNVNVSFSMSLNNIMLDNLRVKVDFFEPFYNLVNKKLKNDIENINNNLYDTVLTIKDNFKDINNNRGKSKYFLLAKEVERKTNENNIKNNNNLKNSILNYLKLTFFEVTTNYGESPYRIAGFSGFVIVFWGVLGWIFQLVDYSYSNTDLTLMDNIYFSLAHFFF